MQEEEKKDDEKAQQLIYETSGNTKSKIWEEWGGKSEGEVRKEDENHTLRPRGKSQDSSDSNGDFGGSVAAKTQRGTAAHVSVSQREI